MTCIKVLLPASGLLASWPTAHLLMLRHQVKWAEVMEDSTSLASISSTVDPRLQHSRFNSIPSLLLLPFLQRHLIRRIHRPWLPLFHRARCPLFRRSHPAAAAADGIKSSLSSNTNSNNSKRRRRRFFLHSNRKTTFTKPLPVCYLWLSNGPKVYPLSLDFPFETRFVINSA